VTPDQPRSAIAEEFRLIKRPLLANAVLEGPAAVENGNLIMISSALPGEGKTFNAINLAISMAMELDYTVLLVDADVSRPSVLREFDRAAQPGLMDVLAGEVEDLSEVLLKTNIDKLSILPAGMPHQRATELLASEGMTQLLEQMAHRYADRIIVFDSPPLLVTTESRVLATHMGQVVLVVEAERTTHAHVRQALAAIEPCPIRMMVLNKSRDRSVGGYYGYGYGYGYGKCARSQFRGGLSPGVPASSPVRACSRSCARPPERSRSRPGSRPRSTPNSPGPTTPASIARAVGTGCSRSRPACR
jgi:protein-tyrosine kinase